MLDPAFRLNETSSNHWVDKQSGGDLWTEGEVEIRPLFPYRSSGREKRDMSTKCSGLLTMVSAHLNE